MTPHHTRLAALEAIADAHASGLASGRHAVADALDVLIDAARCSRASIWLFEPTRTGRNLRCIVVKSAGQPLRDDSTLLAESQYADYFAALVERGMFASTDAMRDPVLLGMRGNYLQANGIGALLDMALSINGRAYGIVCCEQIPGPRPWTRGEIGAARAAITRVGFVIATRFGDALNSLDSVPIAPLAATDSGSAFGEMRRRQ